MSLRVLHVATHRHNIGDGALVAGIHRTLENDLGVKLQVEPLDVLEHKIRGERVMLTADDVTRINRTADLVIIGGGGMIEGGARNTLSGINFNFDIALLERFEVPVVFYALGFNQFRRSVFFHRGKLAQLLATAHRLGMLFTVRNDGSKARLERLLGPLDFVGTVPDPGLYVPTRPRTVPELREGAFNVVLQLAGDRLQHRLGGKLSRSVRRLRGRDLLVNLTRVVTELIVQRGAHVVLCPHLLTDLPLLAELVMALPNRALREGCTLSPVLCGAESAPDFFELYRQADLVIGMRGHSAICSVGLGTPFIGLATHDKVGGFMTEIGLPEWSVDPRQPDAMLQLGERIHEVLADPARVCDLFRGKIPGLREQTLRFHRQIDQQLAGSAWSR
ncbi:MAG: polysaccharide pyruvyl transferase family protein [Planctomycetota bacterium]